MTVRVKLDRAAVAEATRNDPGFRAYTLGLQARSVATGKALARAKGLHRQTGQYEDGFKSIFRRERSGLVLGRLTLWNTAKHGGFIEGGTRPHVIRPRAARVLAFDVGGRRVFAHRVNHPGTKPKRVVRDTLVILGKTRVNP